MEKKENGEESWSWKLGRREKGFIYKCFRRRKVREWSVFHNNEPRFNLICFSQRKTQNTKLREETVCWRFRIRNPLFSKQCVGVGMELLNFQNHCLWPVQLHFISFITSYTSLTFPHQNKKIPSLSLILYLIKKKRWS